MEQKNSKWQERLFGKNVIKCSSLIDKTEGQELVNVRKALEVVDMIGIYFSFAGTRNDDIVNKLTDLYAALNGGSVKKRLEVVQVVLWANNDFYENVENAHREALAGLPWLAVPLSEIELKTRLSRRFGIKSGVATLVLLDRNGATVSASAQERLRNDPTGAEFPWRPRPLDVVLKGVAFEAGGAYDKSREKVTYYDELKNGIKGFYFSANWCPPCRAFTPQLASVYDRIKEKEPDFEIIFVSSDRSQESYDNYVKAMPWLCVPFRENAARAELAELYGIRGIPTLLLLDSNGHVITMEGRAEIASDPLAQKFPWKPRPVNILAERFISRLYDYPALILFIDAEETEIQFAEALLTTIAQSYDVGPDGDDDAARVEFLVAVDGDAATDLVRAAVGLDDDDGAAPLLVAVDLPNGRYAAMDRGGGGAELSAERAAEFAARFRAGRVKFRRVDGCRGEAKYEDSDDN